MLRTTSWSTTVRPPDPIYSALTLLIRLALPPFKRNASIEPGNWKKEASASAAHYSAQGIDLLLLSWRPIDSGVSAKRRVTHWTFKGEALQDAQRIHFYGEYLRDEATGALRELICTR